ncbi:1152_t:CDS:2 [Dentiscutata heterogama]|uniref:1152_t:CDS:1 n=1 Tax=Dentiscutata heterogama TaxID=1316150 RepID=A0ACA9KGT6_9GLOM|nr:1152_t:CDS:2 [Dentiscutata heterogama]
MLNLMSFRHTIDQSENFQPANYKFDTPSPFTSSIGSLDVHYSNGPMDK